MVKLDEKAGDLFYYLVSAPHNADVMNGVKELLQKHRFDNLIYLSDITPIPYTPRDIDETTARQNLPPRIGTFYAQSLLFRKKRGSK